MACPYRIYGDGADSHRNQNFEAMTILPLMCRSHSTMDSRILLSVRNAAGTASSARNLINEVISWSLIQLRSLDLFSHEILRYYVYVILIYVVVCLEFLTLCFGMSYRLPCAQELEFTLAVTLGVRLFRKLMSLHALL